jgi:hypothetical protein
MEKVTWLLPIVVILKKLYYTYTLNLPTYGVQPTYLITKYLPTYLLCTYIPTYLLGTYALPTYLPTYLLGTYIHIYLHTH